MVLNIRRKLILIIAGGFISTFLGSYFVFTYLYGKHIDGIIMDSVRQAEHSMRTQETMSADKLAAALEVFLQDKAFKEVFNAKDRDRLYRYGQPLFQKLKARYGITHFYFHMPDGRNFVRLHDRDIHDDMIERITFKKARAAQGFSRGIELGKTAFALRVVAPYYDGDRLIGYVELGQEIDNFLEYIKGETRNEFAIIVRKDRMKREDWISTRKVAGLPDNWDEQEKFLWISRPADNTVERDCFRSKGIEKFDKEAAFLPDFQSEKKGFACGGFPLHDAEGKPVGVVLALIDISKHAAILGKMRLYASVIFFALFSFTFFIVGFYAGHSIARPIEALSKAAHIMANGDLDYRAMVASQDEIGTLAESLNDMASRLSAFYKDLEAKVAERTSELNELNKRLEDLSITDGLTNLFNHRHFYMRLEEEVRRAARYGRPLSLIIADMDYFKHYNDTHGHPAGDRVLRDAAACLKKNLRVQDVVARYGGEEFSVILPETDKETALALAERLRRLISEQPFPHQEDQPGGSLTMSFGVASFPMDGGDVKSLVKRADRALYKAKENGRNRIEKA